MFFRIFLLLSSLSFVAKSQDEKTLVVNNILLLTINSSINPATYNYLVSGYEKAKNENLDLVLIKLNTPGGLVSTTKDILTLIGGVEVPTAVWIAPEGASATSAGAIIASGAHFLVMAHGTNIGAATPVQFSAEKLSGDLRSKAINDLVALVSSLAEIRGRNAELFSKMIIEAASYTSKDALAKELIDGIVNDNQDFVNLIKTKSLYLKGEKYKIVAKNVSWVEFDMDTGQKLLNILANPSMAYVLFIMGAALLYLEIQMAGGMVAGALGVFCLILAAIGFQVLPLNFGALGLIVLAFILFVLEAFVSSYGLLSLAGIASLISGSLFLFRTDDAYLKVSTTLIVVICSVIFLFLALLGLFIYFDRKKKKLRVEYYTLVGHEAEVFEVVTSKEVKKRYRVRVSGELWNAFSSHSYKVGEKVSIKSESKETMTLEI